MREIFPERRRYSRGRSPSAEGRSTKRGGAAASIFDSPAPERECVARRHARAETEGNIDLTREISDDTDRARGIHLTALAFFLRCIPAKNKNEFPINNVTSPHGILVSKEFF